MPRRDSSDPCELWFEEIEDLHRSGLVSTAIVYSFSLSAASLVGMNIFSSAGLRASLFSSSVGPSIMPQIGLRSIYVNPFNVP